MESNPIFGPVDPYCYSFYDAAQQHDGFTFHDTMESDCALYVPGSSRNLIMPSVQRFLNEKDRSLFMPSIMELEPQAMHTLPDVPDYSFLGAPGDWPHHHRFTSPTHSALESSIVSSEWSGRQQSPLSSPHLDAQPPSPQQDHSDRVAYACGGHPTVERYAAHSLGECVALHDVQKCADELPETYGFGNEQIAYSMYGSYAQEGYQPMQSGDETTSGESYSTPGTEYKNGDDEEREEEEEEKEEKLVDGPASPVIRRRRAQVSRSLSTGTHTSSGRISKRPGTGRRSSHRSNADDSRTTHSSQGNRAFPCPLAIYGCTSTFGSKNEWKRHVNTQHMRLGYWRCDQCPCTPKPNDFNRKDLFMQHVRRMHPIQVPAASSTKKASSRREKTEEQILRDAATRCYRHLRSPPEQSQCIYCGHSFHGPGSWDDRMEHIGRHMETAKKDSESVKDQAEWHLDEDSEKWFRKQQVIVMEGDRFVLST